MKTNLYFKALVTLTLAFAAFTVQAAQTSYYIYDEQGHVIGEYDANGDPIQEHIYLNDRPVAVVQNSAVNYVTTDQLNTPRAITNSSQQEVWSWNSDPFGNGTPSGSLTYNMRLPGQYYDAETGHNYNYMRDYDSSTGRYIESDPIGRFGGLNTYAYVGENPLMWDDRYGLAPWVWNGKGNITVCAYYDQMGQSHPKCKYYPAAGKICRGENVIVNGLTDAAITQAWMFTQLQNDEATIIDQLRQALIQFDKQERANNHIDCKTDCVFGNNIDQYHIVAFEEAGLNPVFYGGNVPQGTPGNPVPTDPSRGPHE